MFLKKMAVLMGLALAVTASNGAESQAKEWTKVRIATEGAYAPWNFKTASGELDGFDIDVSHELCRRMQVECEISAQDWDGIIPALNAGKYDVIVAAMVITDKRREVVDFTNPYAIGTRTLVVTKSGPLAGIAADDTVYHLTDDPEGTQKVIDALKPALDGKVIAAQSSTTNAKFIEQYFGDVASVREYKTAEQIILDLGAGRVDAVFDGIAFLGGTLRTEEGKDLMMVGPKFIGGLFGYGSAVALRKDDPELKEMINVALKSMVEDGTLKELSLKWFHVDISPTAHGGWGVVPE
jgi:octopine/nopaline transport system substrate-binding protein